MSYIDIDLLEDILHESRFGAIVCASERYGTGGSAIHEKTKEVYKKNALNLYGQRKLDYLCRKYGYGQSFDEALNTMQGLDSRFVQEISIGTSLFNINDLTSFLDFNELKDLSFEQIERFFYKINPIHYKGETIIPYVSTIPHSFYSQLFYDPADETKELVQLNPNSRAQTTTEGKAEILAKGLATRDLEKGDIFYYGKSLYYVHDVIITGEGFIGFYFRPLTKKQEDTHPIFSMGPTKFYPSGLDACGTILADLKPEIGRDAYLKARPYIKHCFDDAKARGELLDLDLFSLAATLGQHVVADFHPYIRRLTLFCATGVSLETAERFKKRYLNDPTDLEIVYYRINDDDENQGGDWCDHLGKAFVGLDVKHEKFTCRVEYITPDPDLKFSGIAAVHTQRFFSDDKSPFSLRKIEPEDLQVHLYNKARGEDIYTWEKVRLFIGTYFLMPIFTALLSIKRFFCPSRAQEKAKLLATKFFTSTFDETQYQNCMLVG